MIIIAAISKSTAETWHDYSNPKPIAGVAKLCTDPRCDRRGGGGNSAAQFDTRPARTETLRLKMKDKKLFTRILSKQGIGARDGYLLSLHIARVIAAYLFLSSFHVYLE